jgi:2-polyprenyl-6-methoxyphenol hydroxylase-like FAD-dependent oxidoreductase
MTPAAGSGIKYAMEDAVVAANLLAEPLKAGRVRLRDLAAVQRRREWPTWLIQSAGAFAQRTFGGALARGRLPVRVPWLVRLLFRIPVVRDLPTRLFGFGWRVHVKN